MRFLLDENLPEKAIEALREQGHDIVWVSETSLRGADDHLVWEQAAQESRILITKDLDFPLPGPKPPGLLTVRGVDRISTTSLVILLLDTIHSLGDGLGGQHVVVSPGHIRQRTL